MTTQKAKTAGDHPAALEKSKLDSGNEDARRRDRRFVVYDTISTTPMQVAPAGPIGRLIDQALAAADRCRTRADLLEREVRRLRRLEARHLDVAAGIVAYIERKGAA